jgi:hypothetical protein
MNSKLTLSLDSEITEKAKILANEHNISLSRFAQYLFLRATSTNKKFRKIEDIPIDEFIYKFAEPQAEFVSEKERRSRKAEYRNRK